MPLWHKNRYLDTHGLRLYYLDWGNVQGQLMVLFQGFLAHGRVWDEMAMAFRDRYRVLVLGQRGHGESGWAKDGAYTLDNHVSSFVFDG
ncbi:MAG: hypothetical protein JSW12_13105 [Deltaproteobacteria bacterium]|nr:MAG: hypothetical protein JSW12_13105 [Deltaproteobacteria bacterium]